MTKVVITSAGKGTRLLPFTKEMPKEMMPIYSKAFTKNRVVLPLLQYIYEQLYSMNFRDYCFVVATNSSNYELFGATGDTFVIGSTEKRITKQQTLGSLFFSQNAATFTAAQEMDLSFKLIRAKFKNTTQIKHLQIGLRRCRSGLRCCSPWWSAVYRRSRCWSFGSVSYTHLTLPTKA